MKARLAFALFATLAIAASPFSCGLRSVRLSFTARAIENALSDPCRPPSSGAQCMVGNGAVAPAKYLASHGGRLPPIFGRVLLADEALAVRSQTPCFAIELPARCADASPGQGAWSDCMREVLDERVYEVMPQGLTYPDWEDTNRGTVLLGLFYDASCSSSQVFDCGVIAPVPASADHAEGELDLTCGGCVGGLANACNRGTACLVETCRAAIASREVQ